MEKTTKKNFLQEQLNQLLKTLHPETEPSFGLMTPQHMVEHLTWIIKSSAKDHENPGTEPTKGQLGFQRFLEKGAVFKHFPNDKTKDDLPPLKYASFEEALEQIPTAIARFYQHYESKAPPKGYHPMMGELTFDQIELFHFMHCRYHLWQFGLIETYP